MRQIYFPNSNSPGIGVIFLFAVVVSVYNMDLHMCMQITEEEWLYIIGFGEQTSLGRIRNA